MTEITHDEFIEKYADVRMTFSSYYKYCFTYIGQTDDGVKVSARYGGDANQVTYILRMLDITSY
jgi:hypothetical protein